MTDYTDLIARLRDGFPTKQGFSGYYPDVKSAVETMTAAAAAIAALTAERDALQAYIARLCEPPNPTVALSKRPLYSHVTTPAVTHDDGSQTIFDQSGNGNHLHIPAKE